MSMKEGETLGIVEVGQHQHHHHSNNMGDMNDGMLHVVTREKSDGDHSHHHGYDGRHEVDHGVGVGVGVGNVHGHGHGHGHVHGQISGHHNGHLLGEDPSSHQVGQSVRNGRNDFLPVKNILERFQLTGAIIDVVRRYGCSNLFLFKSALRGLLSSGDKFVEYIEKKEPDSVTMAEKDLIRSSWHGVVDTVLSSSEDRFIDPAEGREPNDETEAKLQLQLRTALSGLSKKTGNAPGKRPEIPEFSSFIKQDNDWRFRCGKCQKTMKVHVQYYKGSLGRSVDRWNWNLGSVVRHIRRIHCSGVNVSPVGSPVPTNPSPDQILHSRLNPHPHSPRGPITVVYDNYNDKPATLAVGDEGKILLEQPIIDNENESPYGSDPTLKRKRSESVDNDGVSDSLIINSVEPKSKKEKNDK